MKVRHIEWDNFPKSEYEHILRAINIGECIDSLPFVIPDNLYSYRIPSPSYWNYKPEIPTMYILEFERIKLYSPDGKQVVRGFIRTC